MDVRALSDNYHAIKRPYDSIVLVLPVFVKPPWRVMTPDPTSAGLPRATQTLPPSVPYPTPSHGPILFPLDARSTTMKFLKTIIIIPMSNDKEP